MPDIFDPSHLIFLHGLEGTSQGAKATLLRGLFPGMLTPDFSGSLEERMATLKPILGDQDDLDDRRLELWRLDGRPCLPASARPGA